MHEKSTPAVKADEGVTAAINPAALDEILSLSVPGTPNLRDKIIGIYLSNSRTLMEKISSALLANEHDAARRSAHALASSSGNVGALGLAGLCRQLEAASATADPSTLESIGADLAREYERVVQALRDISSPT